MPLNRKKSDKFKNCYCWWLSWSMVRIGLESLIDYQT